MTWQMERKQHLDEGLASHLARVALRHVTREYPNKLDHIMLSAQDVQSPRTLHPVFYGSFDWHSCVHGYWLMATMLRRFPGIPEAAAINELFSAHLTPELIEKERAYAAHPSRKGFERPYGWAWLLMLTGELAQHDSPQGRSWNAALEPLASVFVSRFVEFLPKATYPIRVGTHYNTAFALTLALEYCAHVSQPELEQYCRERARRWYADDANCQAWEPGGDDFLSSALIEAECMRNVLQDEFEAWLSRFLPNLERRQPASLFLPAIVSDRTDGKIAHLDGLNLSRAWCLRSIASALPATDARHAILNASADEHLDASLPHIAGDYMGEHWLATFAALALLA